MSTGRQRFSIIPAMAVTDARLEPRDLQVLCLLGRHTDDLGWCTRSQVRMARELNCGRATVQRALGRLVDAGYLQHRPKQRESGADAAHDYRVVIDPPEPPDEAAPGDETADEGVPTGEQGCPPMSGQGVPTHERAPMLTTPVEQVEREGAREAKGEEGRRPDREEQKPADDPRPWERDPAFLRSMKGWGMIDSIAAAWREWAKLSADQRATAERRIPVYQAKHAVRSKRVAFSTYLGERQFEHLADPAASGPGAPAEYVPIERLTLDFWVLFDRYLAAPPGARKPGRAYTDRDAAKLLLVRAAQERRGTSVPIDEAPSDAERQRLVPIERGSPQFDAWARHIRALGHSQPDYPKWMEIDRDEVAGHRIWMPAEWPPGTAGATATTEERSEV